MKKLSLFFLILILLSCASSFRYDFAGFCILDKQNPQKVFTAARVDSSGKIVFSYMPKLSYTNITCWAKYNGHSIDFTISNDSYNPLELNYFLDSFELLTNDGKVFKLEVLYPFNKFMNYSDPLNPGDKKTFILTGFNGSLNDVNYISAKLGISDTFLLLRPVR